MSWHYLQALEEGCSEADCSVGEQSAPSKSMSTAAKCFSSDSETGALTCSRSGTTSTPSMAESGEVESMSLPQGFLASLGLLAQGSSQAKQTTETCGQIPYESFAKWNHGSVCWRTFQRCLFTNTPEPFLGTWPRAGFVHAGTAYQLQPLAPIIDGIDCGLWPTPTARDYRGTSSASWRRSNASCDTLPDAVAEALGLPYGKTVVCQPTFVEELNWWPAGWTDLEPLATDKFRQWLEQHGSC